MLFIWYKLDTNFESDRYIFYFKPLAWALKASKNIVEN